MSILSLIEVEVSVGGPLLLDEVSLSVDAGERVAVVGRNGAGKSTLLRLIGGQIEPDAGEVRRRSNLRVAGVAQEVPEAESGTVFEVVARGLGELGSWIREYHAAASGRFDFERLAELQEKIESAGGWDADRRIEAVMEKLALDGDAAFEQLSGGLKRRALLGQALAGQPDLLLLDEPTNHLDIDSIEWLEEFLGQYKGAVLFVSHDRRFVDHLATRIVEIDRGHLTSWPGDWRNYLRRKEERLNAEEQGNRQFDRKLAEEENWIRQGIKARRTRNEGRVRALQAMRRERARRREQLGQVRMQAADAGQSGKKVIEVEDMTFGWDEAPVIRDFSTTIFRGDRIALIGPNGSGKTTLLKLLLGELSPQAGEVRLGTRLQIAYFDQLRSVLRDDWSAAENVGEGREFITINGREKHVIGYLQDFLFTPARARAPIAKLSGGERNRLLLARLFARPSNLLVMDEPTNDLDGETLELLEELLSDYPGTLLLVSHDRTFLDNVVTASLVMQGRGRVEEYVGGYSDWKRKAGSAHTPSERLAEKPATVLRGSSAWPKKSKLSYKLARELESLPERVEELEARMQRLAVTLNDNEFYNRPAEEIARVNAEVAALQGEINHAYQRWEALESDSPAE